MLIDFHIANIRTWRHVRLLCMLLVLFTGAGTAGYHWLEGWSWFESLWMVVITFSTVGYGEIHPLSPAGRAFTMVLIAFGVGLVLFTVGTITQALLEFELGNLFGKRRMEREIEKLTGHYIICGAGRVGMSAALEFSRKPVPFVVIENHPIAVEDMLVIQGDATQERVLTQAKIQDAVGLVAATTTDATNLYIVLTARGLNPRLKIIARASEAEAGKHLVKAGADSVISPYSFAGHRIAQSFLRPNVVDFLDIAVSRDSHEELVIEEILVDGASRLAGRNVGNSGIHKELGIMVLAIKRKNGESRFNPTANEEIAPGDYLIVMGEAARMPELEKIAAAR